jgi:hypothetical protein
LRRISMGRVGKKGKVIDVDIAWRTRRRVQLRETLPGG